MFLAVIQPPFIPSWPELRPFVGELWLVATTVGVLIAAFFAPKSNAVCGLVTLAGLSLALVSVLFVAAAGEPGREAFRGTLVADSFAIFWKVLLFVFVIGVVLLWFATTKAEMHEGDGPEFFTLLVGATLGMSLMAATGNLLMILLSVELASLPSYVLAGFRKTDRIGAEASLKYVLFGAATSSVMAYGVSLLYGLYGTLNVADIAARLNAAAINPASVSQGGAPLLAVAVFGLIVGLGFKIAAVPFHFWCPDVFEGAGVDVAAFLSVASKGAGLALLLRVLVTIGHAMGYQPVQPLIALAATVGILGAVTATVGNTAALGQENVKRMLAYSSIAHAGYMLCALSLLYRARVGTMGGTSPRTGAGGDPGAAATQAVLLYLAVYLFMNLGAFTVAGMVARAHGGGRDGEQIAAFAGLGTRSPVLAACMTACLFSLVGLPPFAGFVAKLNVMYVLGANGSWWWWLVAAVAINTIFSLYYYARVVKTMYLDAAVEDARPFIAAPLGTAVSISCAGALVLLLIAFGPLRTLCGEYGRLYQRERGGSAPTSTTGARWDATVVAKGRAEQGQ